MTRSFTTIAAALAAAATLAVAAVPASADTFNQKFSQLNFPAKVSFKQDRVLDLNGRYRWVLIDGSTRDPGRPTPFRTVRLKGRYLMVDRMVPVAGKYRHFSELINLRTGGAVQQKQDLTRRDGNGLVWHWGSKIYNVGRR